MKTYFIIVPAETDLALKCNIYSVLLSLPNPNLLELYRSNPGRFKHVGHMNSQGRLVSFDGPKDIREEFVSCEPLMAGLVVDSSWIDPAEIDATARRVIDNRGQDALKACSDHAYLCRSDKDAASTGAFWQQVAERVKEITVSHSGA